MNGHRAGPGLVLTIGCAWPVVCADMQSLPFADDSFGAVVRRQALEHVDHADTAVGEALRVLRPGGVFVFSVPHHDERFIEHVSRFTEVVVHRFG